MWPSSAITEYIKDPFQIDVAPVQALGTISRKQDLPLSLDIVLSESSSVLGRSFSCPHDLFTWRWIGWAFMLFRSCRHVRELVTRDKHWRMGLLHASVFLSAVYWPSFLNVKYLRGCYSTVPSEGARTWSFPWVIASNTLYIKGLYWCHFWCHIWCHDVIFGALPGLMGPEERLGQR